jgi:hypothetical protein
MNFTFDEGSHTYYLDGVKIPSVSEIISPLVDYSEVNPITLANACNYGKAVHRTIELWLKGTLDEDNLPEGLKQPLEEFKRIQGTFSLELFAGEIKLFDKKLMFAGTLDLSGVNQIVDIKTRKYNPITDDLQLAGYEILTDAKCDKYILELLPGKPYNLIKINNKQAKSMFLYMLDYWWKTNEFNNKINQWRSK